ncbi:hypothetical protein GCM10027299_54170 [Larkinella ripae]
MFPLWATFLFAVLTIVGSVLLIKSISRIISIYSAGPRIEGPAQGQFLDFSLKDPGSYEISVKRPALTGIIRTDIAFELVEASSGKPVAVQRFVNLLSQRKDMSGNRIVPIAEFTLEQGGQFRLTNPKTGLFKEKDKLVIMPKTGSRGFLMIFAILFSAILFIGGLVLFILSLVKQ